MTKINRHGLSRDIPHEVKRIVRQECGFGCAICGNAVIEYHHFDPPFHDAHEHSPEGIIALCPACHIKFDHISAQYMREFRVSPRCKRDGFAHEANFLFRYVRYDGMPKVRLGRITATSGQVLRHGNRVLLGIAYPGDHAAPLGITCDLKDDRNVSLLKLDNNELIIGADHYDVEMSRTELIIRRKLGNIVLKMTTNRLDEVEITHLEASVAGGSISCSPSRGLLVKAPFGGQVSISGSVEGEIGIWITDDGWCLLGGGPHTAAGVAQRWL